MFKKVEKKSNMMRIEMEDIKEIQMGLNTDKNLQYSCLELCGQEGVKENNWRWVWGFAGGRGGY